MRFLLDQGLARSTVEELRALGFESLHVGDIGMAAASDNQILSKAVQDGLIVVTLDADFHMLLAVSGAAAPSAIRIRIEGLRARAAAELMARVATLCDEELAAGAAVSVDEHSVRVRLLPLSR